MSPNNLHFIPVKLEHSSYVNWPDILLNISIPDPFSYLDIYILDCFLKGL